MQNNILKYIGFLKSFSLTVCLFLCPLLFFTDITQNPFAVQPLGFSVFGGLFCLSYSFEIWFKKEINFKYSTLDFIFLSFLVLLAVSLLFNLFFTDIKTAFLNDFIRKADYLVFGLIFGVLSAKIFTVKTDFSTSVYGFLKNILLWCLLWLLWKIQASYFVAILIFGLGLYLCYRHLRYYEMQHALDVLLAVCFISCLYGVIQAAGFELFWQLDINKEFGARPVSTFGNPNFLASFTLLFMPYSFLLFLTAKGRSQNIISGLVFIVLGLFLGLSGTRSAWLGLFLTVLIFFICCASVRKIFFKHFVKLLLLMALLSICFYGITSSLKQWSGSAPQGRIAEVKEALSLKNISLENKEFIQPVHQRLMMWICAFEGFKSSPFLGKGLNSFQLYFPFCQGNLIAQNPSLDKIKMQANAVHNEFLEILFEGGIFAFLAYLFLFGLFFIHAIQKIKNINEREKYFYLALLFGLTSVLIDNMLNITLRTLLVSFAFWFIFSLVNNLFVRNKKVHFNKFYGLTVFTGCSVLVCLVICWQLKQFVSQKYELNGYKYLVTGNYKEAENNMARAIKISRSRPEPFYALLNIYIAQSDLLKAEDLAKKTLEFYPAYYEISFRLSVLQNARNEVAASLENLRKTLSLLPTYSPAAELFANTVIRLEQVSEADKSLMEKLSEILPFSVNLKSYLAEIYFKENNCNKASDFAVKTLNKNIFDKTALTVLMLCPVNQSNMKNIERAQKLNTLKTRVKNVQDNTLLKELEKINRQDFDAQILLAEFYFRKGEPCKAKEILEQIKPKDFVSKAYNFALSSSLKQCGYVKESKQVLQEILYADPYDEIALSRMKSDII